MTQEDIENAAREESGRWAPGPVHLQDIYRRDDFEAGFHTGANWRINKMWHSTNEEPEVGRHCIIEVEAYEDDGTKYIDYVSSVWSRFGWTEDYLELIERRSEGQYKITRWAYVEDILPNKEE